jgi:hypothetical protein
MPTERRRIDSLRDIVKYCDQVGEFLSGIILEASDIIRHVYDDVDLRIIWTTATQRIHPVCTENSIRFADVMESPKLAE